LCRFGRVGVATKSSAASVHYTTLASHPNAPWRIRRASHHSTWLHKHGRVYRISSTSGGHERGGNDKTFTVAQVFFVAFQGIDLGTATIFDSSNTVMTNLDSLESLAVPGKIGPIQITDATPRLGLFAAPSRVLAQALIARRSATGFDPAQPLILPEVVIRVRPGELATRSRPGFALQLVEELL
jgi:hypothetical protein